MQRRVLNGESVVAHGAVYLDDGMATGARQASVSLRRIDLRLDRLVETAIEEHRMIMAAGTPLAALRRALRVLHIFDGLSVELIVKRAEMMGRCVPFVVNLFVALSAGFRIHEKVRRNDAPDIRLGGSGEKRRFGSAAFAFHGKRRTA